MAEDKKIEFSDVELQAEQLNATKMMNVCRKHGMVDGMNAAAAQESAISREIEERAASKKV